MTVRKNGRTLIAPTWPELPDPLEVETVAAPAGNPRARRALGIARWWDGLCATWDVVEEQRLARSYLVRYGGSAARVLPVVIGAARPGIAA
ncbi:MAG TPA: hypothetical protein VGD67_05515 [Pseudonocardiaceae bacterium]